MAIYIITGKPRHGKTYFIIRNAIDWIKNGVRIYSNVFLDLDNKIFKPYYKKYNLSSKKILGDIDNEKDLKNPNKQVFYWRNMRDWNKMNKGIIIADEGTVYFNPRKWSQLTEATEKKLMQHGHEDLDIYVSCQHYSRIDITLRVLAERIMVVKKLFPFGNRNNTKSWGLIKITEHYLEDMERLDRAIYQEDKELFTVYKEYMLIKPKFCKVYDTRQLVGKSGAMDLYHEEQFCENENCPQYGKESGKAKIFHS